MRFKIPEAVLELLDPIVFNPVFDELFNHPCCVWARSLPPWKFVIFHLSVSLIIAIYFVAIILVPLHSPFWTFVAQLISS